MVTSPIELLIALLLGVVAIVAGAYLLVLSIRLIGLILKHVCRFIGSTVSDLVRLIGAIPTALVLCLLVVGSIVLGRWSSVGHFARAVRREFVIATRCLYGLLVAHPLRLVGLHGLVEGLEERVAEDVRRAPGPDKPSRRTGQFDGYTILGSLPGGGSGGKLYIAEPTPDKRTHLDKQPAIRERGGCPERVVIKSFSVGDGSSLPNMVRESRALEAAKKLGLILEHELTDQRFFYVMEYVPGQDLGEITRRVHTGARNNRLGVDAIRELAGYSMDLLRTLDHYHHNGLWHKDVKPENIIVHDGSAHLVDFGLVTPLSSAMTLTTHGTEYFRDPELVRMALRGVKVHEVDGAKFDVYAAGAVLYYTLENTFPAHGGLSRLSMKHPDALAWIVRRAMTEYNQRYETAEQMLHDLKVVAEAKDPFALRPLDLPSVRRGVKFEEPVEEAQPSFVTARAGSPNPAAHAAAAAAVAGGAGVAGRRVAAGFGPQVPPRGDAPKPARNKPAISVTSWWTGRYTARPLQDPREAGRDAARQAARSAGDHMRAAIHAARDQVRQSMQQVREQMHQHARAHAPAGERPVVAPVDRRPAYEQLKSARHRVESHRKRAQERFQHGRRRVSAGGIAFRVVLALGALAAAGLVLPRVLDKLDHKLSRFGAVEAPTAGRTATVAPQPQRGPLGPRVMVNGLDVQDVVAPPLQWNDEVPADAAARVEYLRRQLEVVSKAYEAARREVIATVGAATTPAAPKAVAPSVPAMPAEPLGRILLVNNHPAAANAQIRDMIDAEMDRVENVGFEVFRNEELEAQVHRIMATHAGEPLHEIIPNLSQFLDDNEDPEIRGLVWVSGLTSGPGEVECWYIVEGEAQPGSLTGGLKHLRSLKPTKGVIANWTTLTPSKH